MNMNPPAASQRKRQYLGKFPFAVAVRERSPVLDDWLKSPSSGSFTYKYLPVSRDTHAEIGEAIHAQLWVRRPQTAKDQPYVSFEFDPRPKKRFLSLPDYLANDLRSFLARRSTTFNAEFLPCSGKTVIRVSIQVDPHAVEPPDSEIQKVLRLLDFVALHIPHWRETRLAQLLREAQGKNDALDDLQMETAALAHLKETEREEIRKSRIGQGKFREDLLAYWGACAVTGISEPSVLRASHIQRWCESTNDERLDKYNGLLLTANLDALFEAGKISFSNSGVIMIADSLSLVTRQSLGISEQLRLRKIESSHLAFLANHRRRSGLET